MKYHSIGRRIQTARRNARMTQEELAEIIGCTPQHLSAIERGTKTPRLDTFITIANTLHVSADALLMDVLTHPADSLASEFSATVAHLSSEEQFRIFRAIRALTEEL